jgi:hypothetical protein
MLPRCEGAGCGSAQNELFLVDRYCPKTICEVEHLSSLELTAMACPKNPAESLLGARSARQPTNRH